MVVMVTERDVFVLALGRQYRVLVLQAMDEWEQHTCVKFVPRNRERDYIIITPRDG